MNMKGTKKKFDKVWQSDHYLLRRQEKVYSGKSHTGSDLSFCGKLL